MSRFKYVLSKNIISQKKKFKNSAFSTKSFKKILGKTSNRFKKKKLRKNTNRFKKNSSKKNKEELEIQYLFFKKLQKFTSKFYTKIHYKNLIITKIIKLVIIKKIKNPASTTKYFKKF